MEINEEEMDDIVLTYAVACCEGYDTDIMDNLVRRIKKEFKG